MDGQVWVPTVFTKNRDRLLQGEIAEAFFAAVMAEARRRGWLSDDHFTVDGTLLEAWASHKSFEPKTDRPNTSRRRRRRAQGRKPTRNFRGEQRSNDTHESRTDPDARLAKKGKGHESKLAYRANVLMENRNGLIIDTEVMIASGTAEREAALRMLDRLPPSPRRRTLGGDKGYDTQDFVRELRERNVTPHVAQNDTGRRSAIDERTTRHAGYVISQRKRKLVEQSFGWDKTVGPMRKLRHRGIRLVNWMFTFTNAAYNLVRMRTLLGAVSP
jgi:hypothetical protein